MDFLSIFIDEKCHSPRLALFVLVALLASCAPKARMVSSTPSGAQIYINGKDTGKTTPALLEQGFGRDIDLTIVKNGYFPLTIAVSGRRYTVSAELDETSESLNREDKKQLDYLNSFWKKKEVVAERVGSHGYDGLNNFGDSTLGSPSFVDKVTYSAQPVAPSYSFDFRRSSNAAPHSIAVIIGNRNYGQKGKGTPDVSYALNDARAMRDYVIKSLGYREGNVIFIENSSQADLISTFGSKDNPNGKLRDWVRSGKSDVFVYYSGHGAPSLNDGKGYLLPVDADPQRVELTGYPLETLYENLKKIHAKRLTVVIDACFSGSSSGGTLVSSASSISLRVVRARNDLPNAIILTAADVTEVASWDERVGHGLFTRHFLDGVTGKADSEGFGNNNGRVTLGELKSYLESEVTYMARRLYGREQHPQVVGGLEIEM